MPNTESVIQEILEARAAAVARKDVQASLAYVSDTVVSFDLAPPLLHSGQDAQGVQAWFDTWQGEIHQELRDLTIVHGEEVAFARALAHMSGTKTDGQQVDLWYRSTVCLEKEGETWKITHEHNSVPFLMDGSNKAALELKP